MFEPLVEVGQWFLSLIPRNLRSKRPKPNYLMVHYLYLIGFSIIASVVIYGGSFMPYNDALFFAVASCTQSGLNTIDINDLFTYQQVTFMLIASVTNPIFINTMVVFVRLYWFEKRFKHVVKEIREKRRLRVPTISRTKTEMREDKDLESGHRVEGKNIKVLHDTTQPNGMSGNTATSGEEAEFKEKMGLNAEAGSVAPTPESSNNDSDEAREDDGEHHEIERSVTANSQAITDSSSDHHLGLNPAINRDIRFADEVPKSDNEDESPDLERVPEQQDVSHHIEFLQRQQRNAKEGTTLRIPGPREFDRGEMPEALRDSIDEEILSPRTMHTLTTIQSESARSGANTEGDEHQNADDHPPRSGIKFDEPEHPGHHRRNTNNMERTQTTASKFSLDRMRSGLNRRRRGSTSHTHMPHISEARGSMGRTFNTITTVLTRDRDMPDPMPYLSWQATIGRNSAFVGLTEEQREELGGIEYRALKTLAKILIFYYIGFHLSGVFVNMPFILLSKHYRDIVTGYGQNAAWWAVFTSASLFNDLGLTLTPNSMVSFANAVLPLLYGSFLILIGNTGFPVMLRFVIWISSLFASHGSPLWEELRFLLDHPRRCFTLLFPSKATWWLFWVLVGLNGIDLIFFIVLDLNDAAVAHLSPGYQVLDGWFQAASTRTAGFSVVGLADLHPAVQVSYLIMMYISVFPIAISVRRTNVYEEKSLGLFGGEEEGGDDENSSYVGQHLRRQLSFDLWYVFLGLFLIAIIEGRRIGSTSDYAFTMFAVLFEIVSAYGTVGLSLGYPGTNTSFSAQFKILSKLIICAMMIRGRHRGLPYALDRAILLPSENLQRKEAEDADRRAERKRRGSIFAESNEAERHRAAETWSQIDLDENGLPAQHVGASQSGSPDARRTGTFGEDQDPKQVLRRRRSSVATTNSNRQRRGRSRSISRVIAGGLSAGPTFPKKEKD